MCEVNRAHANTDAHKYVLYVMMTSIRRKLTRKVQLAQLSKIRLHVPQTDDACIHCGAHKLLRGREAAAISFCECSVFSNMMQTHLGYRDGAMLFCSRGARDRASLLLPFSVDDTMSPRALPRKTESLDRKRASKTAGCSLSHS